MGRRKAAVNRENCVSCGFCANLCPREAVSIWKGCYALVLEEKCVGCGICSRECPANAIELVDRGE